ncbi:MAG: response regulator transcription factor [Nitrospiraceae bacterium]
MPLSVLLVDDHIGIRRALRRALSDMCSLQIVGEADSVASTLESVERTRPDAIVLDFQLPDGNGLAVIQALRGASTTVACHTPPYTPLIFVFSNYVLPEQTQACLRLGADAVLDKSTELMRLRRLLQLAVQTIPPQAPTDVNRAALNLHVL